MTAGAIDRIYAVTARYAESRKDLAMSGNKCRIETIRPYAGSDRVSEKAEIACRSCRDHPRFRFSGFIAEEQAFRGRRHFRQRSRWGARFNLEIGRSDSPHPYAGRQRIAQCRPKLRNLHASVQPALFVIKPCYFIRNMYSILIKTKLKT